MSEKEINWVDKQAKDTVYITPEKILEPVRNYFGGQIPLDPATEPNNPTRAEVFFTEQDDGLKLPWNYSGVFINPPYGKILPEFIKKISEEARSGIPIIALLPCGARFSTRYWQDHALTERLNCICFVRGRVKFIRPTGEVAKQNPYDSQIYGYNVSSRAFRKHFSHLGKIILCDWYH